MANGNVRTENDLMDPQQELAYSRCIEMLSIPSSVTQTYALLGADSASFSAAFSIFISAGCIAFASSSISVDWDTDPQKRLIAPSFYVSSKNHKHLAIS